MIVGVLDRTLLLKTISVRVSVIISVVFPCCQHACFLGDRLLSAQLHILCSVKALFLRGVVLQSLKDLFELAELVELELSQVALVPLLNERVSLRHQQPVNVVVILLQEFVQLLFLKLLRCHEKDLLANVFLLLLFSLEKRQAFL